MTDPGTPAPEAAPVRVVIVDDDPLVRSALRLVLGGDPGLELVGEAANGIEARGAVRTLHPDIVLMDIRMPLMDGVTATEHILRQADHPQIIVLTTFDADDTVVAALRAGASGFLLKDTPPARILAAIHRVHAGEPMLSPSVTRRLMGAVVTRATEDPRTTTARRQFATLSDRERQIAVAIGQGRTNAEIAAELFISVATVKSQVTSLLAKLGADNRVQIAIRVHEAGLLP